MGTGMHLVDGDAASGAVPPDGGTIESAQLDGSEHRVLVPSGMARTPKELGLNKEGGRLYWGDCEGMRVMRAWLDGMEVTKLVRIVNFLKDTCDASRHCVGIVLDKANGNVYWTQRGPPYASEGRIFRRPLSCHQAQLPISARISNMCLADLPEPVDLDLDQRTRHMLYRTDRGDDAYDGSTLKRARITASGRVDRHVLARELEEGIGVSLDLRGAVHL
ncbi:hypothetical protein SAMN05444172_8403 [Burkholderia sp. GAS332]|nr:hypothetical protein SAMN05444172_8403 [Burkholderia sp. GAS332]